MRVRARAVSGESGQFEERRDERGRGATAADGGLGLERKKKIVAAKRGWRTAMRPDGSPSFTRRSAARNTAGSLVSHT